MKDSGDNTRVLSSLRRNKRDPKPRQRGLTEIRGAYYTPLGKRCLEDVLETMGEYVDALKFAGGAFALMPRKALEQIIETAHAYDVLVSTGGFIEFVLTQGSRAVDDYIAECRALGFDIIEISSGFISVAVDDLLRLTEKVQKLGLKAKAEVGIQFGAGGASRAEALEREGVQPVQWAIERARRFLEAGAFQIMIESEGITGSVRSWRSEVPAQFVAALGLEPIMFEAADPEVFAWYVQTYGPNVNLFVDHSQIVQLEALRQGIWGNSSLWGRVVSYDG